MARYKIVTLIGTRPEIVKLSRVMPFFDQAFDHTIVHTGQNYDYELNAIFFDQLGLRPPDHYLDAARRPNPGGDPAFTEVAGLERGGLSACQTIARVIEGAEAFLAAAKPDAVLIYGDTNSCLSALAAKRLKIPIFHMEAGNRCFDVRVPEEINRRLIDHLSDVNLTLTQHARRYLLAEGLPGDRTFVVGSHMREVLTHYAGPIAASSVLDQFGLAPKGYLLVSLHREETVDDPAVLAEALQAICDAGKAYGVPVLVSTHPRTRARLAARGTFWDTPTSLTANPSLGNLTSNLTNSLTNDFHMGPDGVSQSNPYTNPQDSLTTSDQAGAIIFCKPFGFFDYINLQINSLCTISDSGTLAEEAAILGFPAVWARQSHERPEAIEAGAVVLWNPTLRPMLQSAIALAADNPGPKVVPDYQDQNVSQKIAAIVQGYIPQIRQRTWSMPAHKDSHDSGQPPTTHWQNAMTGLTLRDQGRAPTNAHGLTGVQGDSAMGQLA
jgi:UDP-N-acetylglucosamine 2-epimerase